MKNLKWLSLHPLLGLRSLGSLVSEQTSLCQSPLSFFHWCHWRCIHNRVKLTDNVKSKAPAQPFFHLQDQKWLTVLANHLKKNLKCLEGEPAVLLHHSGYLPKNKWHILMNSWTKALQMAGMSSIQTSQSQKALLRHLESLPHPNSESLRTDSINTSHCILSPFTRGHQLSSVFLALTEPSVLKIGRIPFYVIVSEQEYKLMNSEKLAVGSNKPNQAVFYRYILNTKLIEKIPLLAFTGPDVVEYVFENKGIKHQSTFMYFMCIWLKDDLPLPPEDSRMLYRFFRSIFQETNARLIPAFEKVCPGFGLVLIENGYDMAQTLPEMSIQDWLHIYQLLITSEEYKDSLLQNLIESESSMETDNAPT